ncbi:PAS domain S-box protein [Desulfoplanes sp.]
MEQKRVLVVDDEAGIRAMVVNILAKYGDHVCCEAESAEEARKILEARFFDVIITDLRMSGESGMDFARFCHDTYPHTAVITMTGFGNLQTAKETLEIGVYGHLNKPFESDQLIIAVDNALKRLELEKQRQEHLEELERTVDDRTGLLRKTVNRMKVMQEKLRESEKKYRSILEHMHEAYCRVDMSGHILMANPAGIAMLGYSDFKEVCGRNVEDFLDDSSQVQALRDELDAHKKASNFELSLRRRDNSRFIGLASTRIISNEEEKPVGIEGTLVDITKRKLMEETVRENERNYRIIFEKSPLGIIRFSPEGVIVDCNEKFAELMGAPREGLVGFHSAKYAPPKMRKMIAKALAGEPCVYDDEYTSTKGNKTVDLRAILNPVHLGAPSTEVIATLEDVGEKKRAQRQIIASHAETRQLIENIPSLLIGIADDGVVTQWNPVAEEILGIPAEEAVGASFDACRINWGCGAVKEAMHECFEYGKTVRMDAMAFTRNDGYEGVLGLTMTRLFPRSKQETGLLLMGADITERLNLETQLSQSRKLEAVGQLAAGIAHEINTPTQYISDNTHFFKDSFTDIQHVLDAYKELYDACVAKDFDPVLQKKIEEGLEEADWEFLREEIPTALDQSLEGLQRVADIVLSMKDFSHPGSKEKIMTDINRSLASTAMVSRNVWKYVADLEENFEEALPPVACFPGEINQVFLNLITNAAHAIGDKVEENGQEKGRITVATSHDEDWVEVRISDTGTGIPAANASRVFDPFFTTKEVGRGTGQGLNICRMIVVEKHGGRIDFTTEPGEGTTFVVRLPRG